MSKKENDITTTDIGENCDELRDYIQAFKTLGCLLSVVDLNDLPDDAGCGLELLVQSVLKHIENIVEEINDEYNNSDINAIEMAGNSLTLPYRNMANKEVMNSVNKEIDKLNKVVENSNRLNNQAKELIKKYKVICI